MITMYIFTTDDPRGWEHAIRENNCMIVTMVEGEQENVEAYADKHFDDIETFGWTYHCEGMPFSENCEYIAV